MQQINFTPLNVYSCQFCQREFESKEVLCINEGLSPLCSNKCLFGLYYDILSSYSEEQLSDLAKLFKIKDFVSLTQNNLIFELTKKYPKPSLSSINALGSGSGSRIQVQEPEPNKALKIGSGSSTPIYRGAEPIFEPGFSLGSLGRWL